MVVREPYEGGSGEIQGQGLGNGTSSEVQYSEHLYELDILISVWSNPNTYFLITHNSELRDGRDASTDIEYSVKWLTIQLNADWFNVLGQRRHIWKLDVPLKLRVDH